MYVLLEILKTTFVLIEYEITLAITRKKEKKKAGINYDVFCYCAMQIITLQS